MEVKKCENCGTYFTGEEDFCPYCGLEDKIVSVSEDEVESCLNEYYFLRTQLRVVEKDNICFVQNKTGPERVGKVSKDFYRLCFLIDRNLAEQVKDKSFRVVNKQDGHILHTGSKKDCESYKKRHEKFWDDLIVEENE